MPAGQRRVVVALIVHVPAEDDVAKAESALDRGKEFVLVQIFAAQHAVDVGHRHLDPVAGRVADGVEHLLRCDFLRHDVLPVDRCRVIAQWRNAILPRLPRARQDRAAAIVQRAMCSQRHLARCSQRYTAPAR